MLEQVYGSLFSFQNVEVMTILSLLQAVQITPKHYCDFMKPVSFRDS